MTDVKQPLPSPGVAGRRKGPKEHPKLSLSVFTPPSTGTSDRFPLPPSPSAVHPTKIVDAHVVDYDSWKAKSENAYSGKADGVVISTDSVEAIKGLPNDASILAVSVPLPAEGIAPGPASSSLHITYEATLEKSTPELVENIRKALNQGRVVDLNCNLGEPGAGWEALESLIEKTLGAQEERKGKLILSNILPPPHSLDLPIVKLLTHPTYDSYQSYIASLSLNSNVSLKFLPPAWAEETPEASLNDLSKDAKEWKRRIKMFIGPAVEAFGFQRIIFGSSPSSAANIRSKVGNWYEIARESFAELGVEQEDIDAVFSGNAKAVYGP
ncbi:hypothetical protein ACEPAI_7843 [Sanghuangporus weigelae]